MPEETAISEITLAELLTSPKRRRFVIFYVENGGNGTAAAERADFKAPAQEAVRLLKDAKVREAIAQYARLVTRNSGESRETIIDRELNWASSDIGNYFTTTGDVTGQLKNLDQLTKRQRQCIKKLSWNRNGPVLELHDPGRANRHLAEYAGMISKDDDALTPDDAASLIAAAMDRMDELDASSEPQSSGD